MDNTKSAMKKRNNTQTLQYSPPEMKPITARMLSLFLKSPYTLYCDLFVDPKYRDPMNEYQQMLFLAGQNHEIKIMKRQYPNAIEVPTLDRVEGFKALQQAMKEGVAALHNFPVFFQDLTGNVDILEKRKGISDLGDRHYVIKEIKVAKNIKEHHIIQAFFYNYVIGKIQGYTPPEVSLINRDGEEFAEPYDEKRLLLVLAGVREVIAGKKVTPTYGKSEWPWESYGNEQAILEQDVSIVPGVGLGTKEKLREIGIMTVKDLAFADKDTLLDIKGFGESTVNTMIRGAQALHRKEAIKIKPLKLPKRTTEIYLDLEGTGQPIDPEGLAPIDYLIGALVKKEDKEEYFPFVAHTEKEEQTMLKAFLTFLQEQKDIVIYHWHTYERTHLKKLCEKYNIDQKTQKMLFDNLIDLYTLATKAYAFPTYGNSIKEIAPWMGFHWRQKDVNAMQSIAYYLAYLQDPLKNKDKLQKIIDYNEDDVRAMVVVRQWLAAHP